MRGVGLGCQVQGRDEHYGFAEVSLERAEEDAVGVDYCFAIDLLNGREYPTDLRDIAVVLLLEDGSRLTGRPDDLESMRPTPIRVAKQPTRVVYDKLDVINVPPRQFVWKELKGRFDRDGALALASGRYKQIVLEGKKPALPLLPHQTYRVVIPESWARPDALRAARIRSKGLRCPR